MRIKPIEGYNCIVYSGKQLRRIPGAKAVYSCMSSHDLIKVMSGAIIDAIINHDDLDIPEESFYQLADALGELIFKFRADNLPLNSEQACNRLLTELTLARKSFGVECSISDLTDKDGDDDE